MFIDFADASCSIPTEIDVCIVGAGVMGLAIASHLLNHSARRILLVEEGGLDDTNSTSAVAAELQGGDLASAVANSRARGFGGSSRRWGGQALPFSALDLADRPFLSERGGWPISWEELNRFYPAADRFLGLTSMPFTADLWKRPAVTAPFAEGSDLELSISKYSPHAYLASVYQGPITTSKQADCLINAKVASVVLKADGAKAHGVNVRNGHGREATISARVVVLCSGGIDNPRILLASQQLDRRGSWQSNRSGGSLLPGSRRFLCSGAPADRLGQISTSLRKLRARQPEVCAQDSTGPITATEPKSTQRNRQY
jgi:choline dehydrogenase-like flavoprotein